MLSRFFYAKYFPIALFIISFSLYILNDWGFSIYMLDEAKNAECAREMSEKGEWIVPTFNYELRSDKPPLHYFFMMLSYNMFGVNEFGARFFSAIFGALTILITFLYTRKFSNSNTALWAVFTLLSSLHLSFQFHQAVPDPFLIFFFCWSIFLFYDAIKNKKLGTIIMMYISIALGILAKGPIAIALPGLIFLLYIIFTKQFNLKTIGNLKPFWGGIIVLAVALPWYILVGIKTDWQWTSEFFLKHNFGRYSNTMEGHGGIFLITIAFIFVGMLPFSMFLFHALRKAWSQRKNNWILFNLITSITIIGFFSISGTKLINYTVPAYPFLAVLFGNYLSNLTKEEKLKPVFILTILIGILVIIALYFGLNFDPSLSHLKNNAIYFIIMPLGFMVAYYFSQKEQVKKGLKTIGITTIICTIIFFLKIFPLIDNENPVNKSLQLIQNKEIRFYGKFNPAYVFYLQKEIKEISAEQIGSFLQQYPDGIIITRKKDIKDICLPQNARLIFSSKNLFERPTTVLIGSSGFK